MEQPLNIDVARDNVKNFKMQINDVVRDINHWIKTASKMGKSYVYCDTYNDNQLLDELKKLYIGYEFEIALKKEKSMTLKINW